jgi:hypothetical protein
MPFLQAIPAIALKAQITGHHKSKTCPPRDTLGAEKLNK